jgi:hypothetical protein
MRPGREKLSNVHHVDNVTPDLPDGGGELGDTWLKLSLRDGVETSFDVGDLGRPSRHSAVVVAVQTAFELRPGGGSG